MQHPSLPRVRRGWSGRERHTREKGRSSLRRNSPGKELKYIRNNHLMLNFVIQKFSMRKKGFEHVSLFACYTQKNLNVIIVVNYYD